MVLNQEYCQIDYQESIITRDNSLKWAYNSACIGGGRLLLLFLIEDLTLELCFRGEFKIDMIIEQHTCTVSNSVSFALYHHKPMLHHTFPGPSHL